MRRSDRDFPSLQIDETLRAVPGTQQAAFAALPRSCSVPIPCLPGGARPDGHPSDWLTPTSPTFIRSVDSACWRPRPSRLFGAIPLTEREHGYEVPVVGKIWI